MNAQHRLCTELLTSGLYDLQVARIDVRPNSPDNCWTGLLCL